jgi:hypothetical protein
MGKAEKIRNRPQPSKTKYLSLKQGRNVQAIRVVLGAAGMKLKKRVNLEIVEKAQFGQHMKMIICWR